MKLVTTKSKKLSLEDRIRAALKPDVGYGTSALLLDISGSMGEYLGANTRLIDKLRELAEGFTDVRRFEFETTCREISSKDRISEPIGGTALDIAFQTVKRAKIEHVVLLTDGRPDHEGRALEAARGLKIDVFYVGPDPAPEFLRKLAQDSGGQYGKASLTMVKELSAGVRALLGPGK